MKTKTKSGLTKFTSVAVALAMTGAIFGNVFAASAAAGDTYKTDYAKFDDVTAAGAAVNLDLAREGFVLFKNIGNALPLTGSPKVTVLGEAADSLATGGGGSGAQQRPGAGTTGGSGLVTNNTGSSTVFDSLDAAKISYNNSVKEVYKGWTSGTTAGTGGIGGGNPADTAKYMDKTDGAGESVFAGQNYNLATDRLLKDVENTYGEYNDAAILVISRTGSEGGDNPSHGVFGHTDENEHYLELNDSEKQLIAYAKLKFDKIIVLINSPSVMELGALQADDGIGAILWVGQPGWNGIMPVGEILMGTVNPSGRTVDIWMNDFADDPSWYNFGNYSQALYALAGVYGNDVHNGNGTVTIKNGGSNAGVYNAVDYAEGIYMGYRYYETIAADMNKAEADSGEAWYNDTVTYPFGYGLSYTSFTQEITGIKINGTAGTAIAGDATVEVSVKVTNTGSVAGKEVVQIYSHNPYVDGGIEKAEIDLVGFAKTPEIAAGQNATVTVTFKAKDMAAFDFDDANGNEQYGYELEPGEYTLSLRKNSHTVIEERTVTVENLVTWDEDGNPDTPNNIFSQKGNYYEEANVNSYNWTDSGNKHYMTRGTAGADNLNILTFKDAVHDRYNGTEEEVERAKDDLKKVIWLLTEDNDFTDGAVNSLKLSVNNAANTLYGQLGTTNGVTFDRDTDNPLTVEVETDYKNYWTKTKEDIPATWKQGAAKVDPATGLYPITIKEMRGVEYDDVVTESDKAIFGDTVGQKKWDVFLNQLTYGELFKTMESGNYRQTGLATIGESTVTDQDGPGQLKGRSGNGYAYVCEVVIASTWNVELAERQGEVIGNECMWINGNNGPNVGWYGPAMNIHRNPLAGRNFEYYSQDGLQGGKIAAAVTKGAVSKGCHVYLKHLVLNDQETNRTGSSMFATEQALRQIYLRPFEIATREGNANGFMNSYSHIGIAVSVNTILVDRVIIGEWGFKGLAVTDYGGGGATGYSAWGGLRGLTMGLGVTYTTYGSYNAAKNCVEISVGNKTVESPTQWYWLRESAKHATYSYVNTVAYEKGYSLLPSLEEQFIEVGKDVSIRIISASQKAALDEFFGAGKYTVSVSNLLAGLEFDAATNTVTGKLEAFSTRKRATITVTGGGDLLYTTRTATFFITPQETFIDEPVIDDEPKKDGGGCGGCGGVVGVGGAIATAIATLGGAALAVLKKKKNNPNK